MAISIGIIAALVAIYRRGGEGRLKTLQKTLQRKEPTRVTLMQYPLKKLLSIVFLLAVGCFLEWFVHEHEQELSS
jgi:hypothetical protein